MRPDATSYRMRKGPPTCIRAGRGPSSIGSPDGIRTRATALRGRRARPLHNGAIERTSLEDLSTGLIAGVLGLEPRLTGPEPVGLPITPYPMGISRVPEHADARRYRSRLAAPKNSRTPDLGQPARRHGSHGGSACTRFKALRGSSAPESSSDSSVSISTPSGTYFTSAQFLRIS